MTEPTTPQLTERQVEAIELDLSLHPEPSDVLVPDRFRGYTVALIRDWRALKAKNETLGDVGLRNAQLIDRIRVWSKCADGYPLDEHINNIATENERLREERAKAIKLLSPDVPRTDLCDAARQIVFAHALERGSAEKLQTQNAALREQLAQTQQELADAKADEEYDCNRIKELNARAASVDAIDAFRRAGKNLTLWCTPRAVVVQITLHDEDTSPDIDRSFPTFGEAMRFALQSLQVEQEKPQ